ncbi:DUF2314 domain-containing protein [Paracidovorax valerianellae]|uniref:Uncharacterized conserved protein YegJ, DUF2314 family n=1 Tax=Paracidovorax valerianellae TaxID=187868 RepID=A0A1G6YEX8_9BURK|nr:DUF2314 domain-containing protein [Paracidovorax valerianellae]MDA8445774.1 DUF2314 domain-containing protein [Paracidovorax valerianellae]SDD88872.1 Uncharacterized conserved protein YegJ, DUF2314 family [Paracidovorax valerianellae]
MVDQDIFPADSEDSAMLAAYAEARRTFKFLWRELSWEYRRVVPGLDFAGIKLGFATGHTDADAPPVEHMWVGDVQFDGETVSGTLLNDPDWIASMQSGDRVSAPLAELEDWMYVIGGKVYGGYTVDVLRRGMTKSERQEHDTAWGMDFGQPGQVQVVPLPRAKAGLLGGLLGSWGSSPAASTDDIAQQEHPMSENMGERMDEDLRNHPSVVHALDDDGWSLLQRDALAGNATPVSLLLRHGADPAVRNPHGRSALDLAQQMQWPNIVKLLQGAGAV